MEAIPEKGPDSETPQGDRPPAVIAREIVQALKHDFGRGPTKARTYAHDDCVLVLMREGHTASERTLERGGQQRAVAQGRVDVSEAIRSTLIAMSSGPSAAE